jgi:hypothetical protein
MTNLASRPEHDQTVKRLSKQLNERIEAASQPPEGVQQIRFNNRRRER